MSPVQTVPADIRAVLDETYRSESRRVFSTLVRLVRDFDLAEEALQDAFAEAMEKWPRDGVPDNPRAWLVSTGRFKAIDALRRRGRLDSLQSEIADRLTEIAATNDARAEQAIEDDRLRLVFTCCHPAIDRSPCPPLPTSPSDWSPCWPSSTSSSTKGIPPRPARC